MDFSSRKIGDYCVIHVSGKLDTLTAPEFSDKAITLLNNGERRFVLALSDLQYVSSAGLHTILDLAKMAETQAGDVVCCGADGLVREVLDLAGISSLFPMYDSIEQATSST